MGRDTQTNCKVQITFFTTKPTITITADNPQIRHRVTHNLATLLKINTFIAHIHAATHTNSYPVKYDLKAKTFIDTHHHRSNLNSETLTPSPQKTNAMITQHPPHKKSTHRPHSSSPQSKINSKLKILPRAQPHQSTQTPDMKSVPNPPPPSLPPNSLQPPWKATSLARQHQTPNQQQIQHKPPTIQTTLY